MQKQGECFVKEAKEQAEKKENMGHVEEKIGDV